MSAIKIIMLLTSQATMGQTAEPTGVWFEELATPYYAFVDAGVQVEIASVQGGRIPIDPRSLKAKGANPATVDRFLSDQRAMTKIMDSVPLSALSDEGVSAVFLPGGHGTMWDLPQSNELASFLSSAWIHGKVLAAVCHGPAGLVNVKDSEGNAVVAGRRVCGFTNEEEAAAGLNSKMPFLLETRLRELGSRYESGAKFLPFAVRDGRLVTGQNPASSEKVAKLILEAVNENRH